MATRVRRAPQQPTTDKCRAIHRRPAIGYRGSRGKAGDSSRPLMTPGQIVADSTHRWGWYRPRLFASCPLACDRRRRHHPTCVGSVCEPSEHGACGRTRLFRMDPTRPQKMEKSVGNVLHRCPTRRVRTTRCAIGGIRSTGADTAFDAGQRKTRIGDQAGERQQFVLGSVHRPLPQPDRANRASMCSAQRRVDP